jgi:hypothetical protein
MPSSRPGAVGANSAATPATPGRPGSSPKPSTSFKPARSEDENVQSSRSIARRATPPILPQNIGWPSFPHSQALPSPALAQIITQGPIIGPMLSYCDVFNIWRRWPALRGKHAGRSQAWAGRQPDQRIPTHRLTYRKLAGHQPNRNSRGRASSTQHSRPRSKGLVPAVPVRIPSRFKLPSKSSLDFGPGGPGC